MLRLVLVAFAAALALPAAAQVSFDFNLGPTISWTEDVSAFRIDPSDPDFDPSLFDPETFDSRNASDTTGAAAFGFLGRDDLSIPATVGFQGGVGVSVYRGGLGVRLGVDVVNTSAVYDFESGESFSEESLKANFVNLQIDGRYGKRLGPASAFLFVGPEFRYLLDASEGFESAADVRDGLGFVSAALNAGAGFKVDLGGTRLGPEFRYSLDLTGVNSGDLSLADGTIVRLDEAYNLDTFSLGLVLGGF